MWIEFQHPSLLEDDWAYKESAEETAIQSAHIKMNDELNSLWYGYMVSANENMDNFTISIRGLTNSKKAEININAPIEWLQAVNDYIEAFIKWVDTKNIDHTKFIGYSQEQITWDLQASIDDKIKYIIRK